MGFMINKTTFNIQNCPTEAIMLDNGWSVDEWEFVKKIEDFSNYEELTAHNTNRDNLAKKNELQAQIIELDSKRSRAFFEPSEKEKGLTWLEYYNQEIATLRTQIAEL